MATVPARSSPNIRRLLCRPSWTAFTKTLAIWFESGSHRCNRDRRTVKLMYEELIAQGYRGGYGHVAEFARRWHQSQAGNADKAIISSQPSVSLARRMSLPQMSLSERVFLLINPWGI